MNRKISMEFKDNGTVTIEKNNTKKVKCWTFHCKPLNRTLIVHEDIDNKNCTSVSDSITGYRLVQIPIKSTSIKNEDIKERVKQFISHYTLPLIKEEFKRVEDLIAENNIRKKK